ncbi:phage tail tube protein [Xanthobacteraceae bacterium A53D]
MAQPSTFSGSTMLILVGNGATPTEVFSAPCGLNTKGLNRSAETSDNVVPDCDDPAAPAWTEREVSSLSWEISGAGMLASESVTVWDEWYTSGEAKNVRVEIHSGPNAGRTYSGKALLTQYNISGERGNKVAVDVTISGTGVLTGAAIS